ncbi:ester cyclase [Novosphingobium sp. ZN18A2]|uniref:ester cyclase n=1 Tax=Novosphingobium sp. ZN18A2 TaxID=3079861 RepID=UPI0030D29605
MTTPHPRKQRLAEFIRAIWDEGDADAADRFIAETYTIHHDPGDPWHGQTLDRAGFRDRLVKSRAAFPDQRFHTQAMFADGDSVVMTWLWSATHSGDIPGFPATGRTIRMSGATVYGFDRDDRLTGHWQITDRLGVYQQLQANLMAAE